ncbi:MAG: PD40 domain-containing protein [Deltaproteobacteria bacterium]|nr:PD40 domain-containing protein [Deltaproteobacteria bacterium]MCB9788105.1 PD40 domain-containing protein [Deltaproteobacteria bacterium]
MIPGALTVALAAAMLAPAADPPWCEAPSQCPDGAVCVGGLCRTGTARGRVEVLYPIAVPPPLAVGGGSWLAAEAARVGAQLRADLDWTGFYRVLGPAELPAGHANEGVSASEIDRLDWQMASASRVVRVSLVPTALPESYRLRIRVIEVERFGTVDLPEGDVLVRPGGERLAVAAFVNALVGHDTGRRGVVGSRLVASVEVARGVKEVAVFDTDGGAFSYATRNGSLNLSPTFAPDGAVGYMSYRSGNPDWIVDGRPLSARPGLNAAGAWSPDGRWLALSLAEGSNSDIAILDAATGELQQRFTTHEAADTSPVWSPDGTRLAWVSDRTGSPQIYVGPVAGTERDARRITSGGYNTSPAWSPLGGVIVYAQQVSASGFALMRYDLDTDRISRLSGAGVSAESPAFSPDGRYIVYAQRSPGRPSAIWVMDADGSRPRPSLISDHALFAPDWRPARPATPEPAP